MKIERKDEEIKSLFEAMQAEKNYAKALEKLELGVKYSGIATIILIASAIVGSFGGKFFDVVGAVVGWAYVVLFIFSVIKGGILEILKSWGMVFVVVVNFFPFFLIDICVGICVVWALFVSFFFIPVAHYWVVRNVVRKNLEEAREFVEFYKKETGRTEEVIVDEAE